MPLVCPHCKQNKSFTTIGQPGKIQCAKCGMTFPIEGNFVEEK